MRIEGFWRDRPAMTGLLGGVWCCMIYESLEVGYGEESDQDDEEGNAERGLGH
jgi:hypothetical protein